MSIFNSIEILVVDDEANIRKLFEREMASPGRTIHTVGSAAEAMEHLRRHYCDVIILDIRLPDSNGLELMSQLLETMPNVAIILITGHADVDSAVGAMKNGAYDYITKPFSLERMEQVIEKAYQKVRLQRENDLINVLALPFFPQEGREERKDGFLTLEELERSHISMVMHALGGNKSQAARILGIGRKTLYRKLEKYGLG